MDFYESIAQYYHHIFPLNRAQVAFVQQSFTGTQDLELLDIGCGIGELSFELSKYFKNVHAFDLDESMIERAKHDFGDKVPHLNFNVLDMLEIEKVFSLNTFDAIVCFGNTLVHLDGSQQILDFFKQVKKVLKKEGQLLFQIINYDRIIDQDIKALPTIENDKIKFVRNYNLHHDQKKLDFDTILSLKNTGITIENTIHLYPIRSREINQLLLEAGFTKISFFGNFNRVAFTENSIPLIIEAKK